MSLEGGNLLLWSFIFRYLFFVSQCLSVHITSSSKHNKANEMLYCNRCDKDPTRVNKYTDSHEENPTGQVTTNSKPTVCPSVTDKHA